MTGALCALEERRFRLVVILAKSVHALACAMAHRLVCTHHQEAQVSISAHYNHHPPTIPESSVMAGYVMAATASLKSYLPFVSIISLIMKPVGRAKTTGKALKTRALHRIIVASSFLLLLLSKFRKPATVRESLYIRRRMASSSASS